MIIVGDCLEKLKDLDANSIDSVVTDPPYGLSFMGKKWDYQVPSVEIWREVLRVLKPGGHLLAACGTRTQHRMAINIEDAGFEIRDVICWHHGVGFPKSQNVYKAAVKAGLACECVVKSSNVHGKDMHGLQFNLDAANSLSGGAKPDVLASVRRQNNLKAKKGKASSSNENVPGLFETVSEQVESAEGKGLRSKLQRKAASRGTSETQSQGPSGLDRRESQKLSGEHDRREKPSLEGRRNVQAEQGELHRPEVRAMSEGVSSDGAKRRLRDGTSTSDGDAPSALSNENGSGSSHRPQHSKQPHSESATLRKQSAAQACRSCGKAIVDAGLGTALKPATEFWTLARKPIEGTVAANVLKYGTGGLNIDQCRVRTSQGDEDSSRAYSTSCTSKEPTVCQTCHRPRTRSQVLSASPLASDNCLLASVSERDLDCSQVQDSQVGYHPSRHSDDERVHKVSASDQSLAQEQVDELESVCLCASELSSHDRLPTSPNIPTPDIKSQGRFPSNLILDEFMAAQLDEQSIAGGIHSAGKGRSKKENFDKTKSMFGIGHAGGSSPRYDDGENPGASRFFKVVKQDQCDIALQCQSAQPTKTAKLADLISNLDEQALSSVQEAVRTSFKSDRQSLQCLDSIPDYKKCILYQDLALHAADPLGIGITEITQSLLRLFGSARPVTEENTNSDSLNGKLDQTRFLYQAKASKKERNAGLEGMPKQVLATTTGQTRPNKPARLGADPHAVQEPVANHHPTVKPIKLMEYLVTLITPPGGTVLDPFAGSGSTLVAAKRLGFNCIGIELSEEYAEIAQKRVDHED